MASGRGAKDAIRSQLAEAIQQLRQYTERHPDNAEAWLKLGLALQAMDLSRHEGGKLQPHALEAFDKALALLDPEDEDDNDLRKLAMFRKAVLLTTMGDPARAVEVFNQAVEAFGGDADLYHHLGIACSMLGGEHLTQAVEALQEAVRLGHTDSYEPLVSVHMERRDLTDDQWVQLIDEMKSCEDAERSFCIQFALSKATHELRRYAEAFEHVRVANELQLEQNPAVGHEQHILQATVQIRAIFTREFLHDYANRRSSSKVPVFIIGMMRSGSTLLEQILDMHGEIFGLGEDSVVNGNLPEFRDKLVRVAMSGEEAVQRYLEDSAQRYVEQMLAKVPTERRARTKHVVDKMLFNYRNVGFIHILYPEAAVIHIVRDPMDCLFSIYRQKFDDHGLAWASSLECIVNEYAAYLQLMAHWRAVLPGRVVDVLYDDLVHDTERVIREVIAKLDVEFQPGMLEFYRSQRPVQTNSMSQVRQPINTSGLRSWRKYEHQLRPLMELLHPVLQEAKRNGMLPFVDKLDWDMSYFEPQHSATSQR